MATGRTLVVGSASASVDGITREDEPIFYWLCVAGGIAVAGFMFPVVDVGDPGRFAWKQSSSYDLRWRLTLLPRATISMPGIAPIKQPVAIQIASITSITIIMPAFCHEATNQGCMKITR